MQLRFPTRLRPALLLALGTLGTSAPVWSQTATWTAAAPASGNFMIKLGTGPCGMFDGFSGSADVRGKLDAPYSGVGVTEVVNTLADGNRITHKNTMRYFRDSRGRTRTEFELATLGPVTLDVKRTVVTISDPIAKAQYILHPEDKMAMVLEGDGPNAAFVGVGSPGAMAPGVMVTRRLGDSAAPAADGPKRDHVVVLRERIAAPAFDRAACGPQSSATPVSLGERTIEGFKTTGSKLERVIPAGEVGNELPMTVSTEQWFSPELGVVISSTHHDPMSGDTTYRLTQISRTEPDAKLFAVPADYKRNKMAAATKFQMKLPPPGDAGSNKQ